MDTAKIPTIDEVIDALQAYQHDAPVDLVRKAYEFDRRIVLIRLQGISARCACRSGS